MTSEFLIGGIEKICKSCSYLDCETYNPPISKEQFDKIKEYLLCPTCKELCDITVLEEPKEQQQVKKQPKDVYIQKYGSNEAILLAGIPQFIEIVDNQVILHNEIPLPDMTLKPLERIAYLNKEYSFESLEEINEYVRRASKESFDTLYQKVKAEWGKYIDANNDHLIICAADTIFTYFQDKFGLTHYLLFIGDNNTGKSNNLVVLQYLGYRPLLDISITYANISEYLGNIEEGQGIILEDEADNIEQDIQKMKVYKAGYQSGKKVTRMHDISNSRKQQSCWTYCFKAFSCERLPNGMKTKGYMERIFVIPCSTGNPKYDITEVINPAGDQKYSRLFDGLIDIRKLLLIFRLLKHNIPIPDIKLSIKNRDKQLCKPLIRLFQDSSCRIEIMSTLSRLIADKRDRKIEGLDARLYHIVVNLVGQEGTKLTNKQIWEAVKSNIEGFVKTDNTYETEEFYEISKTKVTCILKDKFGAKPCHAGERSKERGLEFSRETLTKLSSNYDKLEPIRIIADTADVADTFMNVVDISKGTKNQENEHEMEPVDGRKGPKNTAIVSVKPSEVSEVSAPTICPKCQEILDPNPYYAKLHQCKEMDK